MGEHDRPPGRKRADESDGLAHGDLLDSRESLVPLLGLVIAACGLVMASNLASLGFDHLQTSLINANWEFSWSHDLDTILLGIGVCGSLVGARASRARRGLWIVTAVILGLFFLDEVSTLHGEIGDLEKLLYTPVLAVLVVCVFRLTSGTRDRIVMSWALPILIFAFGMHVVGLRLLRPIGYTTYLYQAGVGLKEGTELAGVIMLVSALCLRARAERATRSAPVRPPRSCWSGPRGDAT